MTALPLDVLTDTYTAEEALEDTLAVAESVELDVTAYEEGDVALTLLEILAEWVANERALVQPLVAAGWLDYAFGPELTQTAKEVFNVDRIGQTYASVPILLTNTGTDTHVIGTNDVTVASSVSDKTYRNVEPDAPVTLGPGQSTTLPFVADEAGSASSADPGDLTVVVSGQLGLTATNATAAVGRDEEEDDQLKARCRLKVPAISKTAAGPKGKYAHIAITPSENGGANSRRCDVRGSTVTGEVDVVLATSSGAASSDDIDLVEAALVMNVVGPTETLTVRSATEETIPVTYTLWVYDDLNQESAQIQTKVAQRVALLFSVAPVGGWRKPSEVGKVFRNLLEATIKSVTDRAFQVEVSSPAADVELGEDDVPVLGTVTPTIVFQPAPPTGGTL